MSLTHGFVECEQRDADRCRQRRRLFTEQQFHHHLMKGRKIILLYQKVVSFLFKWSPEQSSSTLSFTYRWLCKFVHCSLMQQEKKKPGKKTVIRASRGFTTAGEWLGFSVEAGLCESAQPNEILYHHMAALWATQWQQHLPSQLVFTLSIFRANGPSQSWSLTCNSPLM